MNVTKVGKAMHFDLRTIDGYIEYHLVDGCKRKPVSTMNEFDKKGEKTRNVFFENAWTNLQSYQVVFPAIPAHPDGQTLILPGSLKRSMLGPPPLPLPHYSPFIGRISINHTH